MSIPTLHEIVLLQKGPLPTLPQLHEAAISAMKQSYADAGRTPFLWIVNAWPLSMTIETPWENEMEKELHSTFMRLWMCTLKADSYTFVSEAFMLAMSVEEFEKRGNKVSEDPRRKDVAMIVTETKDDHVHTIFDVSYPRSPSMGVLGKREDHGKAEDRGTLSLMLDQSRLPSKRPPMMVKRMREIRGMKDHERQAMELGKLFNLTVDAMQSAFTKVSLLQGLAELLVENLKNKH